MAFQKERAPLEKLAMWFGGTVARLRTRDIHTWTVCGGRARGLAMTLYPLLSLRRRGQIRESLA
jgi:hypothetical protein